VRLRTLDFLMCVALAFTFVVAGCGGGSSGAPTTSITVAISGGSATIVPSATFTLTATVSGDSSGAGVTWNLTGAGALSSQTSTSVTYTAPATVPADATVRITATSVTDVTKSDALPFSIAVEAATQQCQPSIAPRGNESALTAPVAFLLKGSGADVEPIAYVGSFTPDGNGGITAGDVDVVGVTAGAEELPVNAKVSSYSYASNGRGCVNLQFETSNARKAPAKSEPGFTRTKRFAASHGSGRQTSGARRRPANALHTADDQDILTSLNFSFVLGSPSGPGRIIDFADGNGDFRVVAGEMHAQSPADFSVAKLSSRYAFGADGWSGGEGGFSRAAIAGSFANTAGNWSLGVADEVILTTVSSVSGGEGGVDAAIDAATGRGTGSYETGKSGGVDFDFTFYMVDGGNFYFISSDDPTDSGSILAGRALAADATSSPLDGYYITASNAAGLCESCDNLGGNVPTISTMHATPTGSATGTMIGGNPPAISPTAYTWTYTLDAASGRVVFATGSAVSIAYLTSGTSDDGIVAFTVGTDNASVTSSGFIASAGTSAPNSSAASLSGAYAYGSAEDTSAGVGSATGVATFDGTSGYTALADTVVVGNVGTTFTADAFSSGTYTVNSDGTGTLTNPSAVFVTNGNLIAAFTNSSAKVKILQIYIKQSAETDKAKTGSK
jgi:hypothetical protein